MKKALFSILSFLCAATFTIGPGCSSDSARKKNPDVPWNVPDMCLDQVEDWLPAKAADDNVELSISASLEAFTASLSRIIRLPDLCYADKIHMLHAEALPGSIRLLGDLEGIRADADRSDGSGWTEGHGQALSMIITFTGQLDALLRNAHLPAASIPAGRAGGNEAFVMDLNDSVLDRYWMYYHWGEVLAGYYDDTGYGHVF